MKWPEDFINKVICGDCLEVLKHIPDGAVDLVLTDIPYNDANRPDNGLRSFDKGTADSATVDFDSLLPTLRRLVDGSVVVFCGSSQVSTIDRYLRDNSFSRRIIIWEKTNPSPVNGEHLYLSGIELAAYGKKSGGTFNAFCKNTVFRFPCGDSSYHPTQKPIELMRVLIADCSNVGDIILDPFCGSGTTLVAAKELGRKYIGIEIEPKYCKIAEDRLRQQELF